MVSRVVAIVLKVGRTLSRRIDFPQGSAESPMSPDELREKFGTCSSPVLGEGAAAERWDPSSAWKRFRTWPNRVASSWAEAGRPVSLTGLRRSGCHTDLL